MIRNEKGRFESTKTRVAEPTHEEMTDAQLNAICYKSKLLNKYFDNYDDLVEAEDEYNKAHAAEIKIKEERAAAIAVVQEKANSYLKLVAENAEAQKAMKAKEEEAYKVYKAELDNFSDKYEGYHLTYTRNGNNVEFKIEENHTISVEKYIKEQQERFQKIWNSFWF